MKEYPIGKYFTYGGQTYMTIEKDTCDGCIFKKTEHCGYFLCSPNDRLDKKTIIYKLATFKFGK